MGHSEHPTHVDDHTDDTYDDLDDFDNLNHYRFDHDRDHPPFAMRRSSSAHQ
jgi:hypothetical protein